MAKHPQHEQTTEEGVDNGTARKKPKKVCPVTRAVFRQFAKPVEVIINGIPMVAEVKEFNTGSLGWYLNGRSVIKVNGTPVEVQVGLNLTAVGSKELPTYEEE